MLKHGDRHADFLRDVGDPAESKHAAWLDLSRERQWKLYFQAVQLKFKLYLEADPPLFAAVEDSRIIGLLVLKSPHIVIPKGASIRELLPRLPRLIGLVPYFFRAIPLAGCTKPPADMPDPYFTLEAIAVYPAHQGKGIGRILLEKDNQGFKKALEFLDMMGGDHDQPWDPGKKVDTGVNLIGKTVLLRL